MRKLFFDCETYCEVPIKNGTYVYAPKAELLLVSWAFDAEPVKVWDTTEDKEMPTKLRAGFENPDVELVCHTMFDRLVMLHTYGIDPPQHRWHDTASRARAHSLPGKLAHLCELFKVPEEFSKHKGGRDLVRLFCMPRPKNSKLRRATKKTHPVEWDRFVAYAGGDTEAMRYLDKRMPKWNYPLNEKEKALFDLDQKINDRGFKVDLELAHGAINAVARIKKSSKERTTEITSGEVTAVTQRDKLLGHLLSLYGVDLPDLRASTLQRRIDDDSLPDLVRELLVLRLEGARTGDSKYKALLKSVSADGRLRGTMMFCGAGRTGRWSGRLFQPHNMARVPKWVKAVYDEAADATRNEVVDLLYPDKVIELVSCIVRACLVADTDRKLVASDLSNIEGRKLAWLAGEEWKLDAFRAYDKKEGPDLYVLAYSKSFHTPIDEIVADEKAGGIMRQIGKVQELALGYQGAVGAFKSMATLYGLSNEYLDEEIEFTDYRKGKPYKRKGARALAIVKAHRNANKRTVNFWYDLERAAKRAILNPGEITEVRAINMRREGAWLRIRLPSGRYLCYPEPRVSAEGKISYAGFNTYSHQWGRIGTYGGKLAENITQAASRDVLAENMLEVERRGYPIVLHVHDELITEPVDSKAFTADRLSDIMSTAPSWAPGLPLASGGYETYRYRKG